MKMAMARMLRELGSLWLTLGLLIWVAFLLVLERSVDAAIDRTIVFPFTALFINLLAAIAVHKRLRQQVGLLIFHLSLALLALLAAAGSMISLKGHVEVTEGIAFSSDMVVADAGPLHPWNLDQVKFVQGPFAINYEAGMNRRHTRSQVMLPDGQGRLLERTVGDDNPMVIKGYRFYTTFNKGFAPILTYTSEDGVTRTGSVHMPSYPMSDYNQGNEWTPPDGSSPVTLWLNIKQKIYDEDGVWDFKIPDRTVLVVIQGDKRRELSPGQEIRLGSGLLRFEQLRTWMGYAIFYDPTIFWMLSAAALAALGLAWHVTSKIRETPWNTDSLNEGAAHAN